ncbi:MAG: hypothetical protein L3J18_02030 [Candidatus Brocadia sp.]|nr:MAG: hypothetical protein L3J18_02030 [Candidatus Brocadia sp.]
MIVYFSLLQSNTMGSLTTGKPYGLKGYFVTLSKVSGDDWGLEAIRLLPTSWQSARTNTPYSCTPKGRLYLVTPSYPSREYAILLRTRIAPLYTHRYKLLYEDLGSQRWYFQPLRYSILQGTPISHNDFYLVLHAYYRYYYML